MDNVKDAVLYDSDAIIGVDVSSGVERSPGVKDQVKLRQFTMNIRSTTSV